MDFYAMNYCNPYFYQDWRMFAPGTRYNYHIYATYEVDHQKQYSFPIQEVLEERNIFNGREFLNVSLTDASTFVHNSGIHIKDNLYKFNNDKYYQIFNYVVLQYLRKKHNSEIENLSLVLMSTEIVSNEKAFFVHE